MQKNGHALFFREKLTENGGKREKVGKRIAEFVKRETVLSAAAVLAVVSCFFVTPDREYLGYIDFRTLILLFCLMTVMAGFKQMGVFRILSAGLLQRVKSGRGLALCLVFLCFFCSMVITNDVSLVTFVPFGLLALEMAGMERQICAAVTFMTIGANLGSMLTPIGNPQNLYLYGRSGMGALSFVALMLPYAALSALMLAGAILLAFRKETVSCQVERPAAPPKKRLILYLALFAVCLLTVSGVLPEGALLVIVLAAVLIDRRELLAEVDYGLLLTFAAFFVFIGNMGRLPQFRGFLESVLTGNERIAAVAASQVISNVPAALLLSGFTDQWRELIIGTNLGGLGTLIASMASLISYKQIAVRHPEKKGPYLIFFTVWNVVFLAILLAASFLLG